MVFRSQSGDLEEMVEKGSAPVVDGGRLIRAVNEMLDADPMIDEFGIIFSDGPVSIDDALAASGSSSDHTARADDVAGAVIAVEHKMALAQWCLPSLLTAALGSINTAKQSQKWWEDPALGQRMNWASRAALLVAADNGTVWNYR